MWPRLEKVWRCSCGERSRTCLFVDKFADGFLEGGRDLVADFAEVGELEISTAIFSDLDIMHRV